MRAFGRQAREDDNREQQDSSFVFVKEEKHGAGRECAFSETNGKQSPGRFRAKSSVGRLRVTTGAARYVTSWENYLPAPAAMAFCCDIMLAIVSSRASIVRPESIIPSTCGWRAPSACITSTRVP